MQADTFQQFDADARARGFDEVIEREWSPGLELQVHAHPFKVQAQVVRGEFWLTCGDSTRHLPAGSGFTLDRDTPHAERYGPQGATVWVARRHSAAPA